MRTLVLAAVLAAPVLAGCLGQAPANLSLGPFTDLAADGAKVLDTPEGVRVFTWDGTTQATQDPLPADPIGLEATLPNVILNKTFQVDARVGYVALDLGFDLNKTYLSADLVDGLGRLQCQALRTDFPATCSVPVPANATSPQAWTVRVHQGASGAGVPFTLQASLHPASHETHGDPLAGVDRTIGFRAVDTNYSDAAFNEAPRRTEPNVGVLKDGAIVAQEGVQTLLSKDGGQTWTNIAPPWEYYEGTHDPMMRVDPWTNTIYVAHLLDPQGLAGLSWSTDEGQTWLHNRATGLPQQDHEKLAVGPSPLPGSPLPVVYYSFAYFPLTGVGVGPVGVAPAQDGEGVPIVVARSLDGGLTFDQQVVAGMNDGFEPDNTGPIEADRAGNVYVPFADCAKTGGVGVAVSHDFGTTWKAVEAATDHLDCGESLDPGLAVDAQGTAYLAYATFDGVRYVVSKDHGDTWGKPVTVSLPGQRSWVHVDAVAGDAGRLAVLYQATSDSAKPASIADGWARWDTFVAFVEGADGAPSVRTGMVNPADDPVQRGCIWMWGGGSPCRNLLDFVDLQPTPDGRVAVVYADGCPRTCETPADSRLHSGMVGVELDGPRLFATKAPWA